MRKYERGNAANCTFRTIIAAAQDSRASAEPVSSSSSSSREAHLSLLRAICLFARFPAVFIRLRPDGGEGEREGGGKDRPRTYLLVTSKSAGSPSRQSSVVTLQPRYPLNCRNRREHTAAFTIYHRGAICRLPAMAVSIINTCFATVIHGSPSLAQPRAAGRPFPSRAY